MGFVDQKNIILRTQKLHYHNLGILCIYYHIFFEGKFKLKSIQRIEIYYLLSFAPITKFKKGMIAYAWKFGVVKEIFFRPSQDCSQALECRELFILGGPKLGRG